MLSSIQCSENKKAQHYKSKHRFLETGYVSVLRQNSEKAPTHSYVHVHVHSSRVVLLQKTVNYNNITNPDNKHTKNRHIVYYVHVLCICSRLTIIINIWSHCSHEPEKSTSFSAATRFGPLHPVRSIRYFIAKTINGIIPLQSDCLQTRKSLLTDNYKSA